MSEALENEDVMSAPIAEIELPGSADESSGFDVFISYRVRPDEELAGELKTLLESAIEPKPRVFVSGLGGLRASASGYREQLRQAAMNAKAYVGLITKASTEREWIFFEAGAAFGRGVLYTPILIDVGPGELPMSIGAYQGVMANDQPRMRELAEDIAKEINARLKPHFAQRYSRFAKAVDAYGRKETDEELSGVPLAIKLMELGRREEAKKLVEELIAKADTPEKKANIRITALVFSQKGNREILELLEEQPSDVKGTAIFKLWMGVHETNPLKAVHFLREATAGALEGFHRRWALTELAGNEFKLGHMGEATARLVEGLSSEDRHLRGDSAQQLAAHSSVTITSSENYCFWPKQRSTRLSNIFSKHLAIAGSGTIRVLVCMCHGCVF